MTGLLTTEFLTFTDMTYLDLSNNLFSGEFNAMFAGLTNLGKYHKPLSLPIVLFCDVSS